MVWIRNCCKKVGVVLSTKDYSNSEWLDKKGQKAPESLLTEVISGSKTLSPEDNGSNNFGQNDDMRPSTTSDGTYDTVDAIAPMSRQERTQEESKQRRMIIQKQRDRIIGLRHAATCAHDISDGPCPISPECAEMKRVWNHISNCSDPNCRVPKCISSRYIVSHYHNCDDARCEVCTAVRCTKTSEQQQQQQQQQDAGEVPMRGGGTISFGSSTHAISCLTLDSTLSNTSTKSAKIATSHKNFETSYRSLALVKIEEE